MGMDLVETIGGPTLPAGRVRLGCDMFRVSVSEAQSMASSVDSLSQRI